MPVWSLHFGGGHLRLVAEPPADMLVAAIAPFFPGFLDTSRPLSPCVGEMNVHLDMQRRYAPLFSSTLLDLACHPVPGAEILLNKLDHPLASSGTAPASYCVGYRNGLLSYPARTGKASCLLFWETRPQHFIVGSLHRLLFVYLSLALAEQGRYLVHAAGIRAGAKGFLFWGASGAGKTTVAGHAAIQDVFSDDAVVLSRQNGSFVIGASPFCQRGFGEVTERSFAMGEAPLAGNYFLRQAEVPCRRVSREPAAALAEMHRAHLHGFDIMTKDLRKEAFGFLFDLCRDVPAWDLFFRRDDSFWAVVRND